MMIKYFISDDLLTNHISGEFHLETIKNDESDMYFITNIIPKGCCLHENCLPLILHISRQPSLSINCRTNVVQPEGDHPNKKFGSVLIFVYNKIEIDYLFPYFSKPFSYNVGVDITFLFRSLVKKNNLELICDIDENIPNDISNPSLPQEHFIISKFFQRSYLYRLTKYKMQSFKRNTIYDNLSAFGLEFILAVIFVIILTYLFKMYGDFQYHEENIKTVIITLVRHLQDLLTWLMGVPVGFKLNRPLSRVLGQFYMFHVTIWENYMMSVIYPFIPLFAEIIIWLSPLGISFFFCLFLDILSLVSLHVICFYVYACKLYRLQVIIICSLYRLFHGQKWNPFRQRVDTGPPDIDRMFTSTLLLALCVFLLPTTTIYYLVFTMFEVTLLIIEYLMCCVVEGILHLPIVNLLTWLFRRPCHQKIPEIRNFNHSGNCYVLLLQFHRAPFSSIYQSKYCQKANIRPPFRISEIFTHIIKGITIKRDKNVL